jgi:hypothetical protein
MLSRSTKQQPTYTLEHVISKIGEEQLELAFTIHNIVHKVKCEHNEWLEYAKRENPEIYERLEPDLSHPGYIFILNFSIRRSTHRSNVNNINRDNPCIGKHVSDSALMLYLNRKQAREGALLLEAPGTVYGTGALLKKSNPKELPWIPEDLEVEVSKYLGFETDVFTRHFATFTSTYFMHNSIGIAVSEQTGDERWFYGGGPMATTRHNEAEQWGILLIPPEECEIAN